jgi:hypothetical protein
MRHLYSIFSYDNCSHGRRKDDSEYVDLWLKRTWCRLRAFCETWERLYASSDLSFRLEAEMFRSIETRDEMKCRIFQVCLSVILEWDLIRFQLLRRHFASLRPLSDSLQSSRLNFPSRESLPLSYLPRQRSRLRYASLAASQRGQHP